MSGLRNAPLLIVLALMVLAPLSGCLSFIAGDDSDEGTDAWVDPVVEIEDANHSHNDMSAHRPASYTHLTLPTKRIV